jgi:MoxR-like ATPase
MNIETVYAQITGKAGVLKGISSTLFIGESGSGKTHAAIDIASKWDAELLFFACYDGLTKEDFMGEVNTPALLNILIKHSVQPDLFKMGIIAAAFTASTHGKIVLLLDELDKANPEVDGFLLSALQEGFIIVNGQTIIANPSNIIIVITINDERELMEALYRRLQRVLFHYPDKKELFFRIKTMLKNTALGVTAIKASNLNFIIDIASWYRSQEGVTYRVKPDELARLMLDLTFCTSSDDKWDTICLAFSPFEQDHTILSNHPAGGRKYILGCIANHVEKRG